MGWIGLVAGIAFILLAIFAGQLGLGGTTFGLKHLVLIVVGVVLVAGGLVVAMRGQPA
jgi:hypothetical protein